MGRVFSVEQVKTGLVPEKADFDASLEGFSESVATELKYSQIDGALVYGSTAIGTYSRRSDLDCMVVLHAYNESNQRAVERIVGQTRARGNGKVQVNPITYTRYTLASGQHEIDRFFKAHLIGDGRLVYGNDPASYMTSADESAARIFYNYLHHKKRSISSVFHAEGDERYKSLARVLELPLAIGRKALRAHDEVYGTSESGFNTAEKKKLAERALSLFSDVGLDEVPREILAVDRGYTQSLDRAIEGDLQEVEYAKSIRQIEVLAPSAMQWLSDLEVRLRREIF